MKTCGARTRAGTPCRRHPVPGKARCKLHGGASTGPGNPFTKHGIYSNQYTDEELAHLDELRDTDLSAEIALARIMLLRLLKAAPYPAGVGKPSEWQDDTDWWGLADRFLGRIGRLVEQHYRVEEVRELQARVEEQLARLKQSPALAAA